MLNMDFIPNDYVQNTESRRTNLMYLILLLVVMLAIGGAFFIIKLRQRSLSTKERITNARIAKAKDAISKFEQLQEKRKTMTTGALTAIELLEPVPRSVLLAALTNNLPRGASLLRLDLIQKKTRRKTQTPPTSKYKKAQTKKSQSNQTNVTTNPELQTYITIEGVAPSDLQVAAYIKNLISSTLLDNIALIESKEYIIKSSKKRGKNKTDVPDTTFRRFRLTAMSKNNVYLTDKDIKAIAFDNTNLIHKTSK